MYKPEAKLWIGLGTLKKMVKTLGFLHLFKKQNQKNSKSYSHILKETYLQ